MNIKYLGAAAVALIVSFSLGRYSKPAVVKTQEVEKVVYKDRVVTVISKDVNTKTVTTKKPDGTVITEIDRTDRSKINQTNNITDTTSVSLKSEQQSLPSWLISGEYSLGMPQHYGLTVEHRLFSSLYVGAGYRTDGTISAVITIGI